MRKLLDCRAHFNYMVEQLCELAAQRCVNGSTLLKLLQFDCQHCETLVDVVVELSGYVLSFLFLCLNQLETYATKGFSGHPPIGLINARADVAGE